MALSQRHGFIITIDLKVTNDKYLASATNATEMRTAPCSHLDNNFIIIIIIK